LLKLFRTRKLRILLTGCLVLEERERTGPRTLLIDFPFDPLFVLK